MREFVRPLRVWPRVKPSSHFITAGRRLLTAVIFLPLALGGWAVEPAPVSSVSLTKAEQAWIAAHPVIRVGYDQEWPPFSFQKADGEFTGIDADLLLLLSQRLALKFVTQHGSDWSDTYARAKRGEFDVLVGTTHTVQREQDFSFTLPYQSFPAGIITRGDQSFLWSVYDLEGKTWRGRKTM